MLKMNLITQEELCREVNGELCREVNGEVYWGLGWGLYGELGIPILTDFFTFQNFEGIILYVKNESDYTKRIV
jgi:hypothetical protein